MRQIELGRTGQKISIIGQGTWGFDRKYLNEDYIPLKQSLIHGYHQEMSMIDTAERYGWGNAETVIGNLIEGNQLDREKIFIASKVWGTHLSHDGIIKAVEGSLKRLKIKTIDLYQIHWPNPLKRLSKTMKGLEFLVKKGKIRHIGVSNFPLFYLKYAQSCMKSEEIASNQVYFSLGLTKPIKHLLPYAQKNNITIIACSPLGGTKGKNLRDLSPELVDLINQIAKKRHLTFHQVALAWLISNTNVQAIPKAAKLQHKDECARVGDIVLDSREMKEINALI